MQISTNHKKQFIGKALFFKALRILKEQFSEKILSMFQPSSLTHPCVHTIHGVMKKSVISLCTEDWQQNFRFRIFARNCLKFSETRTQNLDELLVKHKIKMYVTFFSLLRIITNFLGLVTAELLTRPYTSVLPA